MKPSLIFGIALSAAMTLPVLAAQAETAQHRHGPRHLQRTVEGGLVAPAARAQAAPLLPPFIPRIAPYPDGQGDEDGLSRDPSDCNKGCIGGNPG